MLDRLGASSLYSRYGPSRLSRPFRVFRGPNAHRGPGTLRGPGAFSSPSFRVLWCSSLALAGAQLMERVATSWLALEIGGDALGVGLVLAARMLPSLVFGLVSGTLADRRDRRRLLMLVSVGGALLAAVLGTLVRGGGVGLGPIAAIAFLFGCLQVADTPARQALLYDTVGREAAPSAIALNAVATRFFGAVGALASGVVIATLGIASCYDVVAAGYVVCLALLAALRVPTAYRAVIAHRPSFGRALVEAGRLILDLPAVRTLVLAAMACEVFAFSYATAVPAFARDVLRAGPEGLGTLTSAAALGATVAVILLAGLAGRADQGPRREPLLTTVYVLYGLALVAFALAPSLLLATAAVLIVGACSASFDALQQTMIQLAVPEDQRGRAVGVWTFSIGTAPLGHLEMGALTDATGAPIALLANGVCVVLGALVLVARAPAFRWRVSPHPLPPPPRRGEGSTE